MNVKFLLGVLLLCFVIFVHSEEKVANLLVHKTSVPEAIVNQNLTFTITIYNVGQSPAYDVKVKDNEWPEEDFTIVEGKPSAEFESIAPGANATFSYTIIPKRVGRLSTAAAVTTYKLSPKDSDDKVKIVRSTDLPMLPVLTRAEYEKKYDKHYDEWAIFFGLTMLPIGIPYLLYMYSNNQVASLYERKKSK